MCINKATLLLYGYQTAMKIMPFFFVFNRFEIKNINKIYNLLFTSIIHLRVEKPLVQKLIQTNSVY